MNLLQSSSEVATNAHDPKNTRDSGIGRELGAELTLHKNDEPDGATRWDDIEIRFTSEHRVQVFLRGKPSESLNFADMGFEDRRGGGGKPTKAWQFLLELARRNGEYPSAKVSGAQAVQERAQELRDLMGGFFRVGGDLLSLTSQVVRFY